MHIELLIIWIASCQFYVLVVPIAIILMLHTGSHTNT
jgi:hypothetical protein